MITGQLGGNLIEWHGRLGLLLAQALTGLAANDGIAFYGPFHELAGRALSNRLTGLHHLMSKLLMALAGLHVAAIVFYLVGRKKNLVRPMVTGWKDAGEGQSATGGGMLSFVVALVFTACAMYGASGAWLPEPPPAPAVETPNW